MKHAKALCALCAPTVHCYRYLFQVRLNQPVSSEQSNKNQCILRPCVRCPLPQHGLSLTPFCVIRCLV